MDPATIAALAAAASSLGQNSANAMLQGKSNRKTRQWNEKMYARQRADSLLDYNMQNEYNSPEAQMKRLEMAGLNPNLVYKNGATHDAAPIRSTEMQAWRPEAPQFDFQPIGDAMSKYFDTSLKQAQIDNLKTLNTVAVQDAALRAAQVASTIQGTETSKFNLDQAKQLQGTSLETAKEQLRKLQTEINVTINADERAAAQNSQSITESAERILSIRAGRAKTQDERKEIEARIRNLDKDQELKQLDLDLKKNGINPTDPIYMRILGRLLNRLLPGSSLSDDNK